MLFVSNVLAFLENYYDVHKEKKGFLSKFMINFKSSGIQGRKNLFFLSALPAFHFNRLYF